MTLMEIFDSVTSTIGNIYYFADKVASNFIIKSGKEDIQLFPREETYGFFYIKNIRNNRIKIFELSDYEMVFYFFYNSNFQDKLSKIEEIKSYLDLIKYKVDNLEITNINLNNDEILRDFNKPSDIAGSSEHKLIKIDFNLTYFGVFCEQSNRTPMIVTVALTVPKLNNGEIYFEDVEYEGLRIGAKTQIAIATDITEYSNVLLRQPYISGNDKFRVEIVNESGDEVELPELLFNIYLNQ